MRARRLLSWSLPAAAVLACGAYWTQLLHTQEQARERALANAASRATHLADTLALQAETLLQSADFVLSTVGAQWGGDRQPLPPLPYPAGAVLQLGVLDAKGRLHAVEGGSAAAAVDGLPAPGPGLAIGAPARAPVAGAVSFVRPLPGQGQVLLTLSPGYLTGLLRRLQPTRGDLLLLVRSDGVAVARSDGLVEPLPFAVAPLFERAPRAGEVVSQSWPPEEGRRILGWQRTAGATPLLALAAVDEAGVLRGLQAEQAAVRQRAALGSVALLALAGVFSLLARRRQRRRAIARRPAAPAAAAQHPSKHPDSASTPA